MKCMLCRENDYDVECVACQITVCGSCRLSCRVCRGCVCKRCAGLGFQCAKCGNVFCQEHFERAWHHCKY